MRFWLLHQYTIGDQVYQVGEFGSDRVDATVVTGTNSSQAIAQSLILKMLKSNLTNVKIQFGIGEKTFTQILVLSSETRRLQV
jgi:hypothetical protein